MKHLHASIQKLIPVFVPSYRPLSGAALPWLTRFWEQFGNLKRSLPTPLRGRWVGVSEGQRQRKCGIFRNGWLILTFFFWAGQFRSVSKCVPSGGQWDEKEIQRCFLRHIIAQRRKKLEVRHFDWYDMFFMLILVFRFMLFNCDKLWTPFSHHCNAQGIARTHFKA